MHELLEYAAQCLCQVLLAGNALLINIVIFRHKHMLCAATTASAVLNCEGALPKLLQLLLRTSDAGKLAGSLLSASAQVTLTQVPSLDDIKAVIDLVSQQHASTCLHTQHRAAWLLQRLQCTVCLHIYWDISPRHILSTDSAGFFPSL